MGGAASDRAISLEPKWPDRTTYELGEECVEHAGYEPTLTGIN